MAETEDWSPTGEGNFRLNLRLLREAQGITQGQMASQLAHRGLPFHQQTVQKIERGERNVKLMEGVAIASLLGVSVEKMLRAPEEFEFQEELVSATRRVEEAAEAVTSHTIDLVNARGWLQTLVDKARRKGIEPQAPPPLSGGSPTTMSERLWAAEKQLRTTPDDAVERGRVRAEETAEADDAADYYTHLQAEIEWGK